MLILFTCSYIERKAVNVVFEFVGVTPLRTEPGLLSESATD